MKSIIKTLFLLSLISMVSCDIMKKSTKDKRETDLEQMSESYRRRKGDTVGVIIPVFKYKDTTITTVNREGSQIRTVFDSQGNANVQCIASTIEEMNRNWMKLFEAEKNKTGEKKEEFNTTWILYIFGGFFIVGGIVVGFALKLMSKTIGKHGELLAQIAGKLPQ